MNPTVTLQMMLHSLMEFCGSLAVVYWASQSWKRTPPPPVVKWARHSQNLWIALGFGVAPTVISQLFMPQLMAFYKAGLGAPVSFGLAALYGALFGVAAICSVTSPGAGGPLRVGRALGVSAVLIFTPYFIGWLGGFRTPLYIAIHTFLAVAVLVIARLLTGDRPAPVSGPPPLRGSARSPGLALVIGFLPSAIVLLCLTLSSYFPSMSNDVTRALLIAACVGSLVCCLTASIMLFKRKTGAAIAGGVVLLLLNGFIAFFCGCASLLIGVSFR